MPGDPMSAAMLWILGAGGHGRVVADAAALSGRFSEIAFFDNRVAADGPARRVGRFAWRGDSEAFFAATQPGGEGAARIERHIAIGANARRGELAAQCEALGLVLATVVHPAAVVSADAVLAPGCFVAATAVVATGARIGLAGIVNHGASVDHDGELGRAVHIGPGARLGGNVHVGDEAWIGLGAAVRHGQRVGRGAIVGAGAVVVADVAEHTTVVGNPARPLEKRTAAGPGVALGAGVEAGAEAQASVGLATKRGAGDA